MTNPRTGGLDHGGRASDQLVIKKESPIPPTAAANIFTKSTVENDSAISHLSTSLNSTPSPSTPSQDNPKKSKRVFDRLSPMAVHDPARKCPRGERNMTAPKGLKIRSPAIIRAEQIQAGLDPKFPSFIKMMVKSHVASGFWMGFPVSFCKSFLPRNDTTLVLEADNGKQFQLKYLAYKTGLSGGWGNFAVQHKLLVGDVLIFQLVECYKIKVYIIRANDSREVDGAFDLLSLESHSKENDAASEVAATPPPNQMKRRRQKNLELTAIQKKRRSSSLSRSVPQHGQVQPPLEQPGDVEINEVVVSDIQIFENINSFTDFNIIVNGLCIDSELPEDVRVKYYELCCSKKAFLHDHLPQSLYFKLVAVIIGETVAIANKLKACKPTTSLVDFTGWDKSLESFELLGMMVGFLRNRLCRIRSLALESEGALDRIKYVKAKTEQSRNANEIRKFKAKLVELKVASGKFDAVTETLKQKVERHEAQFQEQVNAPW